MSQGSKRYGDILPHGLLFVIANSTSILNACLNVISMILCSA